mgnify:FL=1
MLGLTFTGEEEQILGATLNAVEVVVHVEQTDGEGEGRDNDTVHLAGGVRTGSYRHRSLPTKRIVQNPEGAGAW